MLDVFVVKFISVGGRHEVALQLEAHLDDRVLSYSKGFKRVSVVGQDLASEFEDLVGRMEADCLEDESPQGVEAVVEVDLKLDLVGSSEDGYFSGIGYWQIELGDRNIDGAGRGSENHPHFLREVKLGQRQVHEVQVVNEWLPFVVVEKGLERTWKAEFSEDFVAELPETLELLWSGDFDHS